MKLTNEAKAILRKLSRLVYVEHVDGCDCNYCTINYAYNAGCKILAIDCFDGSGATSDRFDNLKAKLEKIITQENWRNLVKKSSAKFNKKVSCKECACGSVVYGDDLELITGCDSCGTDFEQTA